MNGYKAFYARKEIEVQAETSYVAQLKATEIFGLPKKKSYLVSVFLCEKQGEQVIHIPNF